MTRHHICSSSSLGEIQTLTVPCRTKSASACNTCNCPADGCVCAHILTNRIDYLRDGNNSVWRELLAPTGITQHRVRALYGCSTSANDSGRIADDTMSATPGGATGMDDGRRW